jgi:hypothetical protein
MQILQQRGPAPLAHAAIMSPQPGIQALNLLQIGKICCKKNTFTTSPARFSNAQLQLLKVKGMMQCAFIDFF